MNVVAKLIGTVMCLCWGGMFADMIYQSAQFKNALSFGDYCAMSFSVLGSLMMAGMVWRLP
jgi:hypothetical protein